MKSSSANTLIVVGGCLVIAPLAFLYFSYRLAAQVLSVAIAHEPPWDKVNFHPTLPEYYVPACLILGALCIGIGVFLSWAARRERAASEPLSLNLS
jgi:formate hydrogenlyase subunit 3/multisubunit Na+/H+ antiporter MnhD subunit